MSLLPVNKSEHKLGKNTDDVYSRPDYSRRCFKNPHLVGKGIKNKWMAGGMLFIPNVKIGRWLFTTTPDFQKYGDEKWQLTYC